jgi:hypothetical protein
MPLAILPRPSLLTSAVVAVSVTTGLAFGVLAASVALATYTIAKR